MLLLASFGCGLIFGLGLLISGMLQWQQEIVEGFTVLQHLRDFLGGGLVLLEGIRARTVDLRAHRELERRRLDRGRAALDGHRFERDRTG